MYDIQEILPAYQVARQIETTIALSEFYKRSFGHYLQDYNSIKYLFYCSFLEDQEFAILNNILHEYREQLNVIKNDSALFDSFKRSNSYNERIKDYWKGILRIEGDELNAILRNGAARLLDTDRFEDTLVWICKYWLDNKNELNDESKIIFLNWFNKVLTRNQHVDFLTKMENILRYILPWKNTQLGGFPILDIFELLSCESDLTAWETLRNIYTEKQVLRKDGFFIHLYNLLCSMRHRYQMGIQLPETPEEIMELADPNGRIIERRAFDKLKGYFNCLEVNSNHYREIVLRLQGSYPNKDFILNMIRTYRYDMKYLFCND